MKLGLGPRTSHPPGELPDNGRSPEAGPPETGPAVPRRWRRRAVKIALPLVILATGLAFAGYLRATRPPLERNSVEERVWVVSAAEVRITDVQPELNLFGEVVAGREVELRPLVAGRVIEVGDGFVDGGRAVQGQLLVAIDPFTYEMNLAERAAQLTEADSKVDEYETEIEAEKSLLARDREQLKLHEREGRRRESLRKKGSGSQKAVDDSRLVLNQQRQQVIVRGQSIARLGARIEQQKAVRERMRVGLARARRDLEETRLTAPFDGFLVEVNTAVGKMVGTGDRLARLIDADWLEVRFHVSNDEFGRLVEAGGVAGRDAAVIWRTDARDFVFPATIERVTSEIDAASGGIDVFARIKNTDLDTLLRPGAFVEVRLRDRVYRDVVRLPETALHNRDTVYVVADGRTDARRVEFVARAGNDILVRGALKPGERVVTTAFAEIGPGVRVAVP